jgi:preprotein translocase SecE subunit
MNKKTETPSLLERSRRFVHDTVAEVRKSTWPDRRVLVAHTFIVIGAVFMMGLFLGISDRILVWLLRQIIPV